MSVFVIVPVKELNGAKSRLSPILADEERKEFCLKMLEDVLGAVKPVEQVHQTVVTSRDSTVLQVAKDFDAVPLKESEASLNQAVSEAINWCVGRGAMCALLLPADIPLVTPTDLSKMLYLGRNAQMVVSPSRDGGGTNALLLAPPNVCPTRYGPRSFQRHIKEALKRKISLRILRSPRIALDIDTVNDLSYFLSLNDKRTKASKFLEEILISHRLKANLNCF
ncbi:MAG: 2-phospho-L-lactate guanylyltransferase [Candidatus Bathyarchaeia archaeon]